MSPWRPETRALLLPDALGMADAVAALASRIEALALPRGTRLACVVPAPFVRYLLVPWNAQMQSRKSRQVFAEHCFRETYGELARDWLVRVDPAGFGAASLACAMSAQLFDALSQMADARGVVLVSVQPALMNAFNANAAPLAAGSTWIVVPGTGTLTLLLVDGGQPARVALVAGTLDRLEPLLQREWFALGRAGRWTDVRVCAPVPSPEIETA